MEKDLRVLYGVWPAAGAFATFALSNGVIQLYWLQDGGTRPTWLLGCWFALYNLVKLSSSASRRATAGRSAARSSPPPASASARRASRARFAARGRWL